MNKNSSPLVSVVIPVYNGSLYIQKTVMSVLESAYPNIEILLVDDGSTDKSAIICQQLADEHKQIRFFRFETNQGLPNALNFAIQQAKGRYIARINQDDLMLPDRLEKQISFLEENFGHVAVGGKITLFSNGNKIIDTVIFPLTDRDIKKRWLYFSPFADPAVMYRKSVFQKTSGYQQRFWPVDDVHMWYELGKQGKLANLPVVVTKVRWHKNAGSIKYHRLQTQQLFKLHLWASKHIKRPSIVIWIFWLSQYIAGYLFPPQYNWWMFRILRKILS